MIQRRRENLGGTESGIAVPVDIHFKSTRCAIIRADEQPQNPAYLVTR